MKPTTNAQNYVFIFRAPGGGLIRRTHFTRAGDAENAARKMARIAAKEVGGNRLFLCAGCQKLNEEAVK